MLKKYWNTWYLLKYYIITLFVLLFYTASFEYFLVLFFPEGVNVIFLGALKNYILIALVCFCVLFCFSFLMKNNEKQEKTSSKPTFSLSDLVLLFLPLTPVVQCILNNLRQLYLLDSVLILLFFGVISIMYIYLIPMLLNRIGSYRVLMVVGLTFMFMFNNMAILSRSYSWWGKGDIQIQLPIMIGIFLVLLFLSSLKNKWILNITILAFFCSNSIMQVISQSSENVDVVPAATENRLHQAVGGRTPASLPNIYLLIYDAYVPNETMLGYGIDNSAQENFLVEQGFQLYPTTYSIYANTLYSMGSVLNISNSIEGNLNFAVAGNGEIIQQFKDIGYTTYGIFPSDYMFRGLTPIYDSYVPKTSSGSYIYLISGILLGEFRFDIGFYNQDHAEFVKEKQLILKEAATKRSFVYSHSSVPTHSQNSGACLPDENHLYEDRLVQANQEMREDIQTITENDPSALIIIAGDHGPYLTRNCFELTGKFDISEISRLDIQDRYGTFLGIKWPTDDFKPYEKITILQDIFPTVFAYIYEDPSFLDLKIDPVIVKENVVNGASVNNGMISGGLNDGEPLFLTNNR